MEALYRQRRDETRPHGRRDDEQPVGLAVVGGEFHQELVVGTPAAAVSPVPAGGGISKP